MNVFKASPSVGNVFRFAEDAGVDCKGANLAVSLEGKPSLAFEGFMLKC